MVASMRLFCAPPEGDKTNNIIGSVLGNLIF